MKKIIFLTLMLLVLTVVLTGTSQADALMAHWKLDADGSDGVTLDPNDDTGNGYDGINNGAVLGTGIIDGAGDFVKGAEGADSAGSDFIDLTSHMGSIGALTQGTVTAWVKTTFPGDGALTVISAGGVGEGGLFLFSGELFWRERDTYGTYVGGSVSAAYPTDGEWHLVGLTVDPSGNGRLYIDGVAVDTGTGLNFFGDMNSAAKVSLLIGSMSRDNSVYYWQFGGLMDDMRVYDYDISIPQMEQLYVDVVGTQISLQPVDFNVFPDVGDSAIL